MTAKEYLWQAWEIKQRIESMTGILAFLKSSAGYTTPAFTDMPQSKVRNIHKSEDAIIRAMEYEDRIQTERDKLAGIMDTISRINDPTAQAIVVKRYIDRKAWDEIAGETYISMRQVHRLHRGVLDEITESLKMAPFGTR